MNTMIKEQLGLRMERVFIQILRVWATANRMEDEKNEWEDRELIEMAKKANLKSTTVSGLAAEILEDGIRQRLR